MSTATTNRGRSPLVVLLTLGALSTFGPLAMDFYLPGLPELTADLGASEAAGQLTLTACTLGLALGQIITGPLSDRMGRRRPLVAGVVLFVVFSALCALAPSIQVLVALRFLQGFAGSSALVVCRAIVRDTYRGADAARTFALLMTISGAAPILSPLIGSGLLLFVDWRGLFVALAVIGVAMVFAALSLAESLPSEQRIRGGAMSTIRPFGSLLASPTFMGFTFVRALGSTAMFVYISISPYVIQQVYGLSSSQFALMFAANGVGIVIGARTSAMLVRRLGSVALIGGATGIIALAGIAVVLGAVLGWGVWPLLASLFVLTFACGIVGPNGTALAMEHGGAIAAGTASAILGALGWILGGILPPILSLGGATQLALGIGVVGASTLSLGILALVTRHPAAR